MADSRYTIKQHENKYKNDNASYKTLYFQISCLLSPVILCKIINMYMYMKSVFF